MQDSRTPTINILRKIIIYKLPYKPIPTYNLRGPIQIICEIIVQNRRHTFQKQSEHSKYCSRPRIPKSNQYTTVDSTTITVFPSVAISTTTNQTSEDIIPPIINHTTIVPALQTTPTRLLVPTERLYSKPIFYYRPQHTQITLPTPTLSLHLVNKKLTQIIII